MMSTATRLAPVLLVVLFWIPAWTASAEQPMVEQNQQLALTIHRYFASNSDYREGNLICRSQVEELQQYLRRTRGNIPAIHRRLLNRVLADEAPLTQFFYTKNGEAVLCAAANELAGYAKLEAAARMAAGRIQIKAAIQSNQSDALVEFVKQEFPAKSRPNPSQQGQQAGQQAGQQQAGTAVARIYTLEQFIEAAQATPSSRGHVSTG
jgi:hypothetical protein